MTEWWRNAVVYQLYVRSYADSNGDGRGDLRGIIDRLDHLGQLGVDAVWLTPCYPSPQHDHGYDVADYFSIEPMYGDLADFDELIVAATTRGIKVLMDVVPNHCSEEHVWFREALRAVPGSAARDRFYFRDGRGDSGELPPNNWRSVFGGSVWTRTAAADGTPGQWYLHTFAPEQPDFNWESQDVIDHFDAMFAFWFDRGVEGFRIDAVAVAGKAPGLPDAPQLDPAANIAENDVWSHNPYSVFWPSAHQHWQHWRTVIDEYQRTHPGRELVTVSEAYTPKRPDLLLDYVNPREFHQSFCFDLMLAPWHPSLLREAIALFYETFSVVDAPLTWTINNHDTQRSTTRYGRADATLPSSYTGNNLVYTNTPIDLAVGLRRTRAMIMMAAALPGSLYLYQGEELGLPEVLDIPADRREDPIFERTEGREIGRDGCRIPMPWNIDRATGFGFSTTTAEPWLPQPADWGEWSIERQHADPASTLHLYRRTVALRRAIEASAPLEWVLGELDELVAFRRGDVMVVLNVSDHDVQLPLSLGCEVLLSSVPGQTDTRVSAADSCLWLRTISSM